MTVSLLVDPAPAAQDLARPIHRIHRWSDQLRDSRGVAHGKMTGPVTTDRWRAPTVSGSPVDDRADGKCTPRRAAPGRRRRRTGVCAHPGPVSVARRS